MTNYTETIVKSDLMSLMDLNVHKAHPAWCLQCKDMHYLAGKMFSPCLLNS